MAINIRHASHSGYSHGCRCTLCKEAHRIYERNMSRRRRRIRYGLEEPVERFVDATEAREHIHFLASRKIGLGSIALKLQVHRSNMQKLKNGRTKRITPELNDKILAIPAIPVSPNAFVPVVGLESILKELYDHGYTLADVARQIGVPCGRIKLKEYVRLYRYQQIERASRQLIRNSK